MTNKPVLTYQTFVSVHNQLYYSPFQPRNPPPQSMYTPNNPFLTSNSLRGSLHRPFPVVVITPTRTSGIGTTYCELIYVGVRLIQSTCRKFVPFIPQQFPTNDLYRPLQLTNREEYLSANYEPISMNGPPTETTHRHFIPLYMEHLHFTYHSFNDPHKDDHNDFRIRCYFKWALFLL